MEFKKYEESAEFLKARLGEIPETAIILGSGLAKLSDSMERVETVDYSEIPGFPRSTVQNHKGELIAGFLSDSEGKRTKVLVMNGRFHYYEGYEMEQTAFPVGVFALLGIKKLVLSNAAGGINLNFHPGDLVIVTDHIKLTSESPARGENHPRFGARFFDMQSVYDKSFMETAEKTAIEQGFALKRGVYAFMSGPQYETPAEIRMLRLMGADLVGMSTVAEVIAAARCKIRVLCISCVSNYAAGVTNSPLSHEEVCEAGEMVSERFTALVRRVVCRI